MPRAKPESTAADTPATDVRDRILHAAYTVFTERGYAAASMLEIATRARVSKRELYTIGNKQQLLVACINSRSQRMQLPDMPVPHDRESFAATLAALGARIVIEVSNPKVLGMYRLAIAEAERSPEVAQALDSAGQQTAGGRVRALIEAGQKAGLIGRGDVERIRRRFMALIWEGGLTDLLLRLAEPPSAAEINERAKEAVASLLRLYPPAETKAAPRRRS